MMENRTRQLLIALLITLLIEAGLLVFLLSIPHAQAYLPLRIVKSAEVYNWSPTDAPDWWQPDVSAVREAGIFEEALADQLPSNASVLDKQLIVMDWVRAQAAVVDATQAIPGDPLKVLAEMRAGTPAQCGNFANLMMTAATSVGLENVRIWHLLASDGAGGQGHVANEVWSPRYQKWVFLDPMNNAYTLLDDEPASLLEVRHALLTGQEEQLELVVGDNAHTSPDTLLDSYQVSMVIPSLQAVNSRLSANYAPTLLDRVANSVPTVGGLQSVAKRVVAFAQGRVTQMVLMDDLARTQGGRLPVTEIKLGVVLLGFNTAGIAALIWMFAREKGLRGG